MRPNSARARAGIMDAHRRRDRLDQGSSADGQANPSAAAKVTWSLSNAPARPSGWAAFVHCRRKDNLTDHRCGAWSALCGLPLESSASNEGTRGVNAPDVVLKPAALEVQRLRADVELHVHPLGGSALTRSTNVRAGDGRRASSSTLAPIQQVMPIPGCAGKLYRPGPVASRMLLNTGSVEPWRPQRRRRTGPWQGSPGGSNSHEASPGKFGVLQWQKYTTGCARGQTPKAHGSLQPGPV